MSDVFGGWTMAVKSAWLFLATAFQSRARLRFLPGLGVVLLFAAVGTARAEPTIACPPGTYDMVDWMTMDSDLRSTYHLEGSSNPVYTMLQNDRFYWIKGGLGYPWDIQLYDNNYIYLWVTELSYAVPESYKKFTNNNNLPLVPRCATAGFPGSTIQISNSNYDLHTACSQVCSVTLGLQNAINQVWGPYYVSLGGDLPDNLQILIISYQYSCDGNFQNCIDKEEYWVNQRYGLVQWRHLILVSDEGRYAQIQRSVLNSLVVGTVTPYFPCF